MPALARLSGLSLIILFACLGPRDGRTADRIVDGPPPETAVITTDETYDAVIVGSNSGDNRLTVQGADVTTGLLTVGDGSDGNVAQIIQGGTVTYQDLFAIGLDGSNNQVEVSGPGSSVMKDPASMFSDITVGESGSGNALSITGGGSVTGLSLMIGDAAVANVQQNTVTVTGAGSQLSIESLLLGRGDSVASFTATNNSLVVKDSGSLTIASGAMVGFDAATGNTLEIGTNGVADIADDLFVGAGNTLIVEGTLTTGTLSLDNGAFATIRPATAAPVDAAGTATLAGTLKALMSGLGVGTYALITAGTRAGEFQSLVLDQIQDGLTGTLQYGDQLVSLVVSAADLIVDDGTARTVQADRTANDVIIGNTQPNQSLTVSQGAVLTSQSGTLGHDAASDGNSATIDGQWNVEGTVVVGKAGSGNSLTVNKGVSASQIVIGEAAGADDNAVTVTGSNALLDTPVSIVIGQLGLRSTLTVTNGADVTVGNDTYVGDFAAAGPAAGNTLRVNGEGSTFSANAAIYVGHGNGGNTMTVENAGRVNAGYLIVGNQDTADNNTLSITGASTTVTVTNEFAAGRNGSDNSVTVTNGASLATGTSVIGGGNASSSDTSGNSVNVSGNGSQWTAAGLKVGASAGHAATNNSLVVENRGSVSIAGNTAVGEDSNDTGNSLTVRTNGQFASTGAVSIGTGNALNVQSGGTLSAQALTVDGTLNVDLAAGSAAPIQVAGAAAINGTLRANALAITAPGSYGILDAASFTGDTSSFVIDNLGQFDTAFSFANNRLSLIVSYTDLVVNGQTTLTGTRNHDEVSVGGSQSGSGLVIGAGAMLNSASATVGPTGGNLVTVAGTWNNTGAMTIEGGGAQGNGLTIDSTGRVVTGGSMTLAGGSTLSVTAGGRLQAGTLALADGSSTILGIASGPASAALALQGAATLNGALTVNMAAGATPANRISLLTAQSISGTFDSFTSNAGQITADMLRYTGTEVYLLLRAAIGTGGESLSGNQSAIADAINAYSEAGGSLPAAFDALFGLSGNELSNALDEIAGEPAATGGAAAIGGVAASFLSQMLNDQADVRSGPAPGSAVARVAGMDIAPAADTAPDGGWRIRGSIFGSTAELAGDGTAGSHDTGADGFGIATVWDTTVGSDGIAGVALAGGGTRWDVDGGLGSGKSTFLQAGAYGAQRFGAGYVALAGGYGWHAMSTEREIATVAPERLEADFSASSLSGRIEAGHRFAPADPFGITPYGAFQAHALLMPGYKEHAAMGPGDFALAYDERTVTTLRSELGLWLDSLIDLDPATARLFGRLAWAHDWSYGQDVDAVFQSASGVGFTVIGAEAPADLALVSAGTEIDLGSQASLGAAFDGEIGRDYASYGGSLTLGYTW